MVVVSLTVFSVLMLKSTQNIKLDTGAEISKPLPKIIIDPGHGGEDGGAVVAGVLEKNINLSISRDLSDLINFFGCDVTMTRTDDSSLSGEGDTLLSCIRARLAKTSRKALFELSDDS